MVEIPIERQTPEMSDEQIAALKLLVRELPEMILELDHVQHWTISEICFDDDTLEQWGML